MTMSMKGRSVVGSGVLSICVHFFMRETGRTPPPPGYSDAEAGYSVLCPDGLGWGRRLQRRLQ